MSLYHLDYKDGRLYCLVISKRFEIKMQWIQVTQMHYQDLKNVTKLMKIVVRYILSFENLPVKYTEVSKKTRLDEM